MFLPLHDGLALRHIRRARSSFLLLALTLAVHLALASGLVSATARPELGFGLIPARLFGYAVLGPDILHAPAWMTPISSLLLHGSFWHLTGNMLFLWVFGDNVEDAMGHARFFAFYVLCGIGAGLAYAVMNSQSQSPLIGASGAISGIAAAYMLLHPRARIVGLLFNIIPVVLSAAILIGGWIVYQVASAFFAGDTHTGWWAHVGGILTGIVLLPLFKRSETPWFGRAGE